jgi:hypothetical protein
MQTTTALHDLYWDLFRPKLNKTFAFIKLNMTLLFKQQNPSNECHYLIQSFGAPAILRLAFLPSKSAVKSQENAGVAAKSIPVTVQLPAASIVVKGKD